MRLRHARLINLVSGRASAPRDLLVSDDRLLRTADAAVDDEVIDLGGRFVMPGLWDAHVHFDLWAASRVRLDVSECTSAAETLATVHAELTHMPAGKPLIAVGARNTIWSDVPGTCALDAVSGDHPVAVCMNDLHCVWVNTAGLRVWGFPDRATGSDASGILREHDAFALEDRLDEVDRHQRAAALTSAQSDAAARGVVGIVDMQTGDHRIDDWRERAATRHQKLRVRIACWPATVNDWVSTGLSSGEGLDDAGWLTSGPLKVIADGSISARTAWCALPYVHPAQGVDAHGQADVSTAELSHLMSLAERNGISMAVHAIGDAAVTRVVDCFTETGAHGSIEHATVMREHDLARMAALGLTASVQPVHRHSGGHGPDIVWAGQPDRLNAWSTMADAGIVLTLGSDAPVASLDPWRAISAAVCADAENLGSEHLDIGQALRASTDGISQLVPGGRADLVVVDDNPFSLPPAALAGITPRLTIAHGRITHRAGL